MKKWWPRNEWWWLLPYIVGISWAIFCVPSPAKPEAYGPERRIYPVIAVHDGDTLTVQTTKIVKGRGANPCDATPGRMVIRLLGLDAPEIKGPFGRTAQPFGEEAAGRLQALLAGRAVWVEYEAGARKDRYGRTLAFVHRFPDGLLVNEAMLAEGLARVRTVGGHPKKRIRSLRAAEQSARETRVGIWSVE